MESKETYVECAVRNIFEGEKENMVKHNLICINILFLTSLNRLGLQLIILQTSIYTSLGLI